MKTLTFTGVLPDKVSTWMPGMRRAAIACAPLLLAMPLTLMSTMPLVSAAQPMKPSTFIVVDGKRYPVSDLRPTNLPPTPGPLPIPLPSSIDLMSYQTPARDHLQYR